MEVDEVISISVVRVEESESGKFLGIPRHTPDNASCQVA